MAKFKYGKKDVPLALQKMKLKQVYGDLIDCVEIARNQLTAIINLKPSEESRNYKVKVVFKPGYWPQAWLIDPKELEKVDGKPPHHIYDPDKKGYTKLCVFYPKNREWNDSMLLADVFVPWVITWLSAYEYWQITGFWVYPESKDLKPKISDKQ